MCDIGGQFIHLDYDVDSRCGRGGEGVLIVAKDAAKKRKGA